MSMLRITRLGHGGVLYRSPNDAWLWVDRWTSSPDYPEAYRLAERVDVVAPTHGHFDHVGDDAVDLIELARVEGAQVVCSHEMSLYLGAAGIEATGMNAGGRVEVSGIGLTMVTAVHTGGVTLTEVGPGVTRDMGSWGWVLHFEDDTVVYHSGDTDLFGDMALIGERYSPSIAVLPIGGHYTMGPVDAGRAATMAGVAKVIPVHYSTFPILTGTPAQLSEHTSAEVIALAPGETWEAKK